MAPRDPKTQLRLFLLLLFGFGLLLPVGQADDEPAQGVWAPETGLVLEGDILTMNASREVISNGRLFIKGGKIVSIARPGQALPPEADGVPRVETDGLIAPGLIDAHNHLEYNHIRLWDVPEKYHDMYDWMGSKRYERALKYPKRMVSSDAGLVGEIGKFAELKAIIGGTTSIQGSPFKYGNWAFIHHFVRNVEMDNFGQDKIYQRSVGIMDTKWRDGLEEGLLQSIAEGRVDAWLVHLSEGTTEESRAEFDDLEALGLLGPWTVIVHGISLGRKEYEKMAAVDAKLVASPHDNYLLYGETNDLVAADEAGVTISLGSDWSPYGSKNLLSELKIFDQLNDREFGGHFTDREIVEMATVNPARTLGWEGFVGHLAPGMHADITIFDRVESDPYRNVIVANEMNVQLVLIEGEPLYGDLDRMERLKGEDCEVIWDARGREKAVDITTEDTKVPNRDQSVAEIVDRIEKAMSMDLDFIYEQSSKKKKMTRKEFKDYIAKKYPMGLEPLTMDRLYATGDDYYFDAILRNKNARFDFDIREYYDGQPKTEAILADLPEGWRAALRDSPKGTIEARLDEGTPVHVIERPSHTNWVRVFVPGHGQGWVYSGWVKDLKAKGETGITGVLQK